MAQPEDDGGIGGGGGRAEASPEPAAGLDVKTAKILASMSRMLGADAEPGRVAGLEAEIDRLLEGFDDRLAVVNRQLDRILERRA